MSDSHIKTKNSNNKAKNNKLNPKFNPNNERPILNTETRNNLMSQLRTFMTNRRESDRTRQTHMWFGETDKIMFRVEDEEYDQFVNLVAETTQQHIVDGDKEALHILERPLKIGMLCFDLDIKFYKTNTHNRYIEPQDIIEKINKTVKKYFNLTDNKSELMSYYLVKDGPYYNEKNEVHSDGIHIAYPNLILNSENKNFICDLVVEELLKNGDFDVLLDEILIDQYKKKNMSINFSEENNTFMDENGNMIDVSNDKKKLMNDTIFDRCVFAETKWFMYGSGKEKYKNKDIYKIKYIFDGDNNEIDEIPDAEQLVKILAIRKCNERQTLPNDAYLKQIQNKSKSKTKANNPNPNPNSNPNSKQNSNSNSGIVLGNLPGNINRPINNIDTAKKMVKLLSAERATPYETWRNVGLALYEVSPTLLPEFLEFSQKSEGYNMESCQKFWMTCQKRANEEKKYTIASLKFWAKQDNPIEYGKFQTDSLNGYSLEDIEKITDELKNVNFERDHEIALIINSMYGRSLKCSSIKNKTWFHFDGQRWNNCDDGYILSNLLSEHFTKIIHKMYKKINSDHIENLEDDATKQKKDMYYKYITKLNKNSYKKILKDECTTTFFENNFVYNLDENRHLIGFENGVYDLDKKEFRDGLPEDKITFSTGYSYNMDYTVDHPDILEIERVIKSIQPKDDVRLFMLCHIASCLRGGNKEHKIVFWIGPGGRNGKSTIQNLISGAFGRYYKYVENTLITKERANGNEASPDIIELKGVRCVILSELEPGVKIHAGFFKRITGGDPLKGRPLYHPDIIEFLPQFGMILISNILPEFNSINDNAVWKRTLYLNFDQKFVDKPKAKNEHKIDIYLPQKLEKLKGAFMWLLINKYYPIYEKVGLDDLTPECVKESTNLAKVESEPYLKFTEEQIIFDEDSFIDTDTLKGAYNEWYTSTYNKRATKPAGIIDYFVGEGFVKKGKIIKGIRYELNMDSVTDSLKSDLDV
jgi:P4 family phage/plasmid primase-like protien